MWKKRQTLSGEIVGERKKPRKTSEEIWQLTNVRFISGNRSCGSVSAEAPLFAPRLGWYIGRTKISFYYTNPSNTPAAHLALVESPGPAVRYQSNSLRRRRPENLTGVFFFFFLFFQRESADYRFGSTASQPSIPPPPPMSFRPEPRDRWPRIK